MSHELIAHPTRDFGKDIPKSLNSNWFTRVSQLTEGDKIVRINCDQIPCPGPCTHNPEVVPGDIYQVIKVEPWNGFQDTKKNHWGNSTLVEVYTDYGYFVARKSDFACIVEHGGEKIEFALDKIETDFAGSKIDEIYAAVLPEMAEKGIEDTLENRHAFLTGLKDGWLEDEEESLEKSLYVLSITMEIAMLQLKINREAALKR